MFTNFFQSKQNLDLENIKMITELFVVQYRLALQEFSEIILDQHCKIDYFLLFLIIVQMDTV